MFKKKDIEKFSIIWTISELYYPEDTSTGYFMTRITESLSTKFKISAICAQPYYSSKAKKYSRKEFHKGVNIIRVSSTTFNKNNAILRFINIITFCLSTLITGIVHIRNSDTIFVVTNPPFLPLIAMLICKIKGAKYVLRIDDVYPDILIVSGKIGKGSIIKIIFNYLNNLTYRNAEKIVVLGRDMRMLIIKKDNSISTKVKIITNWGQTEIIKPNFKIREDFLNNLGINDKFVLLWAGNMGIPHGIVDILNAAKKLADNDKIHFVFIGSGSKKNWLMHQVKKNGLSNFTFLQPLPRSDQKLFLNSCDIVLSSLIEGMYGISVPSRIYNIFSAGKPILAIGERDTELAQVISQYKVGWNIIPSDTDAFVKTILYALSNKNELIEMGKRARKVAVDQFSERIVIDEYMQLFSDLIPNNKIKSN